VEHCSLESPEVARKRSRRGRGSGGGASGHGLSKGWTWAIVLALVAGFAAFVLEPLWRPLLSRPPAPGELLTLGASLYRQNCAACHGPDAQGQVAGQPMGGQRADGTYIAPALNGTAHAWHHAPGQLFELIKHGSPAPDSPMKGWAERMSDREIEAVLAYIQSLWPERLRARYRSMHNLG